MKKEKLEKNNGRTLVSTESSDNICAFSTESSKINQVRKECLIDALKEIVSESYRQGYIDGKYDQDRDECIMHHDIATLVELLI